MELFAARGHADVTVSEIAQAAQVYPNQITHHFGSKDALYVEAAFGLLLRDSERLRSAGRRATTPDAMARMLARTALALPSIPVVVGALAVARDNPAVEPALRTGLGLLFRQSERYLERTLAERGWLASQGVERGVKTFWSAVFGAVLIARAGYPGGPSDVDVAATLVLRPADQQGDGGRAPRG
jgi:AcrR family transcriptional regulator